MRKKKPRDTARPWLADPGVGHDNARLKRLWVKYGISGAQYDKMFVKGDGKCWLCGRPPKTRLHVDHDHRTSVVRGLLDFYCNKRVVGRLNAETARRVLAYLDSGFDGRNL